MTWCSKKYLDFQDFSLVFKLKEEGHHHTDKGKILIDSFIGQMNNNRLSTSAGASLHREDKELLISQAKKIIQGPSNYKKPPSITEFDGGREAEKGKTFIISENKWLTYRKGVVYEIIDLNGNVVTTCKSITAVIDFLEVSLPLIHLFPSEMKWGRGLYSFKKIRRRWVNSMGKGKSLSNDPRSRNVDFFI